MPYLMHLLICFFRKTNDGRHTSIALSKQDKLFKDDITTSAVSNLTTKVVEDLLTYFIITGNRECFSAMLYVCFDNLFPLWTLPHY